jgi:uncharacterized protein YaaR (DUF327 family)
MDKDQEIDLGYHRGPLLESINAILSYQRMKEMLDAIDKQINELAAKDAVHNINNFKNPRQEQKYLHDVYTLTVLKRRQERLKQKLAELQDRIQSDIETDKRYINTQ